MSSRIHNHRSCIVRPMSHFLLYTDTSLGKLCIGKCRYCRSRITRNSDFLRHPTTHSLFHQPCSWRRSKGRRQDDRLDCSPSYRRCSGIQGKSKLGHSPRVRTTAKWPKSTFPVESNQLSSVASNTSLDLNRLPWNVVGRLRQGKPCWSAHKQNPNV